MPSITREELRERAREEADQENSGFVSDAALNRHLESAARQLMDLLVTKTSEDHYTNPIPTPFTLAEGVAEYTVPTDLYKVRGVDFNFGDGFTPLSQFEFADRGRLSGYPGSRLACPVQYRYFRNKLIFLPAEFAAGNYQLWYIPLFEGFANDAAVFDGENGWEEFIVLEAAIRCIGKEESDTSELVRRKRDLRLDIIAAAQVRDYSDGGGIQDVRRENWEEC